MKSGCSVGNLLVIKFYKKKKKEEKEKSEH